MKIYKILFIFILISSELFSQRERGYEVEVVGPDLISLLNNTSWVLKKVLNSDDKFAKKRKAGKMEELHLSFVDGKVKYYYPSINLTFYCDYKSSTLDKKNDYMYLTIYCKQCNYYWTVYRLSRKKLVVSMSLDKAKNGNQTKLERYVFYRESDSLIVKKPLIDED